VAFLLEAEFMLVRNIDQVTLRVINPAMKAAGHSRSGIAAKDFLAALRDDFVRAVRAYIVKCRDLTIAPLEENDRCLRDVDFLHFVVAGGRKLFFTTNAQPSFAEYLVLLEFILRLRER